jgi:hypothetical protein
VKPEADQPFLVGPDLVEFDRRDVPIYQTEPGDLACNEPVAWGAPLDRLFGDGENLHIDGTSPATSTDALGFVPDPLVELATLADSLPLPPADPAAIAAVLDGAGDAHVVAHLHDGWTFDYSGADWTFDGQS